MKQIVSGFSLVLFFSSSSGSEPGKTKYLSRRVGTISFTDGLREADFRTGFDGESVYGRYLTLNFALEVGTGYFHDGVYIKQGFHFPQDIQAIPATLTAKVICPSHPIELFASAGFAVYFTK